MLGVNSEQKESMQHYISDSIYGLTLAWITSENSTKQLECRHLLTRSSSLDPIFSAALSGVDRISVPVANSQLLSPTNSLSRPLTTSGYGEISGPKTLCLVFRQNRHRIVCLAGNLYSVIVHYYTRIFLILIQHPVFTHTHTHTHTHIYIYIYTYQLIFIQKKSFYFLAKKKKEKKKIPEILKFEPVFLHLFLPLCSFISHLIKISFYLCLPSYLFLLSEFRLR